MTNDPILYIFNFFSLSKREYHPYHPYQIHKFKVKRWYDLGTALSRSYHPELAHPSA